MDLNGLSLLVDIIEAGNLSRAAAQLGMSRANVSKRLNHFERQIGAGIAATQHALGWSRRNWAGSCMNMPGPSATK